MSKRSRRLARREAWTRRQRAWFGEFGFTRRWTGKGKLIRVTPSLCAMWARVKANALGPEATEEAWLRFRSMTLRTDTVLEHD